MSKWVILLTIVVVMGFTNVGIVNADLLFPGWEKALNEYNAATCSWGSAIECNRYGGECNKYKNNPNYIKIAMFKNSDKYCAVRWVGLLSELKNLVLPVVITLIIELSIWNLVGVSSKRDLVFVGVVNIVTVIVANLIVKRWGGQHGLTVPAMVEMGVVFIEGCLINVGLHKKLPPKVVWLSVITANLVSLVGGMIVIIMISYLIKSIWG